MTVRLLDVNVLVALTAPEHVHHERVREPVSELAEFSTCPITQLGLVRVSLRLGSQPETVGEILRMVTSLPGHRLWSADLPVDQRVLVGLRGHRQTTDFYLAALARHHGGRLLTLDEGLALAHPDVVELVPG